MKCPSCGSTNGSANKFCRECGFRLAAGNEPGQSEFAACAADEVALGEELFDVMQLYSAGDLEGALSRIDKVIRCSPESVSAHSILALIYERKAARETEAGRDELGRDYMRLAAEQYETVVGLNPKSVADREKLASLRARLDGGSAAAPAAAVPKGLPVFREAIRAVPPQFLVAAGVFLVVLMLTIILIPGSEKDPVRAAGDNDKRVQIASPSNAPGAAQADTSASQPQQQPLRVYTFPTPPQSAPAPSSPSSPARRIPPINNHEPADVGPVKLPPLGTVTVVPEPRDGARSTTKPESRQPDEPSGKSGVDEKETPSLAEDDPAPRIDGQTMLARAIDLHNQGRNAEAIGAAQQAMSLFQADIDAGRNVGAASRGVENARKLVRLWQQTAAG